MVRPVVPLLAASFAVALGAGCSTRATLEPQEADRIRRSCAERIASGRELTRRTRDIGKLPAGTGVGDRVVIYGASWCTACHYAADYFVRYGIPFVELDVEADPAAERRMRWLVTTAELTGERTLPVIEARGTVMLGFMPCVVEAAWRG